jgi:hypothetical protein
MEAPTGGEAGGTRWPRTAPSGMRRGAADRSISAAPKPLQRGHSGPEKSRLATVTPAGSGVCSATYCGRRLWLEVLQLPAIMHSTQL